MDAVKAFNNELSSLYEGKPPISKAKMTQLTRTAIKGIKFYKHVVQSVEKFIQKCRPEYKVPGLYVIDSIVRQSRHQFGLDKDLFVPRFSKNIVATFQCLYKCPPEEKPKIVKVLNLWQKNNVFATDVIQPLLDMANIEGDGGALVLEGKPKTSSGEDNSWKAWNAPSQTDASIGLPQQSGHNNDGGAHDKPILDSAIISQLQEITSQLLTNPKDDSNRQKDENAAVKFNKKLLDFDYGDDEEEQEEEEDKEENGHATTTGEPTALALSMAQNLLSNPELLHQLQQMQQTIQMTEALKSEISMHDNKKEPGSQNAHHQQQMPQQQLQQQQQQQVEPNYAQQHLNLQHNFNNTPFSTAGLTNIVNQPLSLLSQQPLYNMSPPLYPPPNQNFPPVILPPNLPMEGDYPMNLHGMGVMDNNRMDMDHLSSMIPKDNDERHVWQQMKDSDDRDSRYNRRDRSRSRSRSPRGSRSNRSSRKSKRSRSRSPRRRRSSSRSPSRHRNDRDRDRSDRDRSDRGDRNERSDRGRRSDSKDWERDRSGRSGDKSKEKSSEKSMEVDPEKEKEKEKERERRKMGLTAIVKKNFLAVCSTTLWLGHVPKMVPESEIKETFTEFGPVTTLDVIPPRGCAYICMEKRQDAAKALRSLKHLKYQGSSIKMAWAPGKGVKGKEYKEYWDTETGVTLIPYEKMPSKGKVLDLADGGMIDEDSLPENMQDLKRPKVDPEKEKLDQIVLPKDDPKQAASGMVPAQMTPITVQQVQQQVQQQVHQQQQQALAAAAGDQATMIGAPMHMAVMPGMQTMTSMPSPYGMMNSMVSSQAMLLPQIPLPMGVPPPNQIMIMSSHGTILNPPPSMAVMNPMGGPLPNIRQPPPTATAPIVNQQNKDPDQMDENSDGTPTDEDKLRSSGIETGTSSDVTKTTSSLPTNFPSNPPTNMPPTTMPIGFPPGGFQIRNMNPMGMAPWPPNGANGPNLFTRPPPFPGMMPHHQLRMPLFPSAVNINGPLMQRPPLLTQNVAPNFNPPPKSMEMSKSRPPPPSIRDDSSNANAVPLGRPRGNFGNKSPPSERLLGPPPDRMHGKPMDGMHGGPMDGMHGGGGPMEGIHGGPMEGMHPGPMEGMHPGPHDGGFRPPRPLLPGFGPRPGPGGGRFPFGNRPDGPPFMMRGGPPGMGMRLRMDFRGPPPDDFGPEWRDRRQFGPPPDWHDHRREEEMDFPPPRGGWDREEDDRGRRRPDFGPPDDRRGWDDRPQRFRDGPDRDFRGGGGFERGMDDRRMMRGGRDRGFDFNRGGRDRESDHRDNRFDDGPGGDPPRERSRGRDSERRNKRESRWNRSRSQSPPPSEVSKASEDTVVEPVVQSKRAGGEAEVEIIVIKKKCEQPPLDVIVEKDDGELCAISNIKDSAVDMADVPSAPKQDNNCTETINKADEKSGSTENAVAETTES